MLKKQTNKKLSTICSQELMKNEAQMCITQYQKYAKVNNLDFKMKMFPISSERVHFHFEVTNTIYNKSG